MTRTAAPIMEQQKRFILAMFLSAGVLIAWQSVVAPPVGPQQVVQQDKTKKDNAANTKKDGTKTATKTAKNNTASSNPNTNTPPPAVKPKKDIPVASHTIETKDFKVTFTNKGGKAVGLTLKDPAQYQKAGDLLSKIPKDSENFPFLLSFDKGSIALPTDTVFEVVHAPTKEDNKLVYRHVDPAGRFRIDKVFAVQPKHPHMLDLSVTVTNTSSAPISERIMLDLTGYKNPEEKRSFLDFRPAELEGICRLGEDTERILFDSLTDDPKTFKEKGVLWGAVGVAFFIRAVIPEKAAESCIIQKVDKDFVRMRLTWKDFEVAPQKSHTQKQMVYLGPKDIDTLSDIGHNLTDSVDYGIFSFLAKPMRWLLNFFYGYVHNWGLAIILLTLLIKVVTWPFTEKSYANAERMKEIQPLMDEIREKYENDQQRLAEETMKLFQEHKFNPMGGCLPMLLQMPILYALYVMIVNSVELYQAEFILWYTDLSASDPYFVLPILMGASMIIQQKFMMTSTPNQQTKIMMQVMPIMFTALMLFLPSGLVLYYFLNLLLGLFQQFLIKRKFARKKEAAAAA